MSSPEHVHVLLSEPEHSSLAQAIQSLKQGVSRSRAGNEEPFRQKRYYDHNVRVAMGSEQARARGYQIDDAPTALVK